VAAAERRLSKEQVEHRLVVRAPGLPVAVGHGELIEVGEQRLLSNGRHGVIFTLTRLTSSRRAIVVQTTHTELGRCVWVVIRACGRHPQTMRLSGDLARLGAFTLGAWVLSWAVIGCGSESAPPDPGGFAGAGG